MDRHYYYRLLGLTCDASRDQIEKAYENRMNKLNSPDYADDPEYRRKKKEEATMAYKMLTGGVPLLGNSLKRKRNDDCDVCVDEDDKPSFAKRFESALNKPKKKKSFSATKGKRQAKGGAVLAIILTMLTLISSIFTIISDLSFDEDYSNFYDGQQAMTHNILYYGDLDLTTIPSYSSKIDWSEGEDEYGNSDTYYATCTVLSTLEVDDADEFFGYISNEEDFFRDEDDLTCADTLIEWIGAPDFKEIAGSKNEFTGEIILNHADYLYYLDECLWNYMWD